MKAEEIRIRARLRCRAHPLREPYLKELSHSKAATTAETTMSRTSIVTARMNGQRQKCVRSVQAEAEIAKAVDREVLADVGAVVAAARVVLVQAAAVEIAAAGKDNKSNQIG